MPVFHHQGISLHYEVSGAGPALLLGHSFLCTGEMWREQLPALGRGRLVVNPDFRGHGRSGPATNSFTLYDAVADGIALLDHLGVERAVWIGLPIGGMVALRAALRHPERVAGLVLLASDAGDETGWHRVRYRAMALGVRGFGMSPFLPSIGRLMFGSTTRRDRPALVDEWKARFAAQDVPSMLRGLDALLARDSVLDRLHEIDAPTLILVGAEDRSLPPPRSRRMHERLPGSRLEVVAGAGHLAALEQPSAVNLAILDFLQSLPARLTAVACRRLHPADGRRPAAGAPEREARRSRNRRARGRPGRRKKARRVTIREASPARSGRPQGGRWIAKP